MVMYFSKNGYQRGGGPVETSLSTRHDNIIEKRSPPQRKGVRKISDDRVREIRKLWKDGLSFHDIAKKMHVHENTARLIITGVTRRDVK